jgi:acyl-CoA synthetase (AMP-forming)/AMP-acid ligase II
MAGGAVDLIGRGAARVELRDAAAAGVRPGPPFGTLVDALRWRGEHQSDRVAYRFLPDGESGDVALTYGRLDQRARAIAGLLQSLQHRGDRALLVYPPGLEFITAYVGCLYAGTVAVIVAPPNPSRLPQFLGRLGGICRDATPSLVLTTPAVRDLLRPHVARGPAPDPARWLAQQDLAETPGSAWSTVEFSGSDLAFLQYTSGSTTEPKGVMVSHGNLIHNLRAIEDAFAQPPGTESVCWLPPQHDMGLIGGILAPLYLGTAATLLSPVAFVQRPIRWLQAISRYRATVSGGPNFAYAHCLRRITPEQRSTLDLSNWEVAFCGAEPISVRTLREFEECFAPCGFRSTAFKPCYGLAEATLLVSAAPGRTRAVVWSFRQADLARHQAVSCADGDEEGTPLPSSGRPVEEVIIVDPESCTECAPGRLGEIWASGPSVALGYWNRPGETAAAFLGRVKGRGESFLRTGDLGFLLEGELFVTGRIKDLIIIDGANHYPQDIEHTVVACHPVLESAECAAFSVQLAGREELVVVVSPGRRAEVSLRELHHAIRTAVVQQHDLRLYEIVLVQTGRIPRTTSGKIRRGTCRSDYLAGTLDPWRQQ